MASGKQSIGSLAFSKLAPRPIESSGKLKLHLGCGKRFLPGFVHVDRADFPHIDFRCGVDSLPMFESDAAELIYASHMLEYFDRIEALQVLGEWRRVLCPGGLLRLAVPDFDALVEVYSESKSLNAMLGPLYGRMEIAATNSVIYHKTAYNFESLRQLLEEAGFRDVLRYDWRRIV